MMPKVNPTLNSFLRSNPNAAERLDVLSNTSGRFCFTAIR